MLRARPGRGEPEPDVDVEKVVAAVEEMGLIGEAGRKGYDAGDLWMVRMVLSISRDGVPLDDLARLCQLADVARALAPLVLRAVDHNRDALIRRELRFRDLAKPYSEILWFAIDRALDIERPGWRGVFAPLPAGNPQATELAMSRS